MEFYLGDNPEERLDYFINRHKTGSIASKREATKNRIGIESINGRKLVSIDGITIALDCWDHNADVIFISHAHMDHIPNIPSTDYQKLEQGELEAKFLCSSITKQIAESRTGGKFRIPDGGELVPKRNDNVKEIQFKGVKFKLIQNGHTFGSTSLFIEGSQNILYTGDFISGRKPSFRANLKPIKCDYLITECSFGSPQYVFPTAENLKKQINNCIKTQLSQNHPVILLSYAFGKSQNLLKILEPSFKIILDGKIAINTRILEENGIEFPNWESYKDFNQKRLNERNDYVLLVPRYSFFNSPYKNLVSAGVKVAILSGNVLNERFQREFIVDYYFPFSDHCDFFHLVEFVKKTRPKQVYLHHGSVTKFYYYLKKHTEIEHIKIL